ncbi:MAG TPA: IPTL-CTERM sorting domain-containing protein [Longimicrobium sp.]|nr:IPTL-CTERM sorting domain-containing protein [Longimicrobium sp.]
MAYNQSFNTLSSTAGSTTNNLTITGWFMTETGGGARDNEQYAVDTGGSNTGDTFSYGAAGNADRALGGLQSGTLIPVIGACFTNNTGGTISTLNIAYTGEQWRIANTAAARDDRMDFQYSLNATDLATGTWTDVNSLDFTNPIKTAGTAGALDGNAAANRTAISSAIPALSIANGATFWIRWNDLNASGADDGLAVDDFSLTPNGGPVLPNLSINDVSLAEGNAGTTTFTFTVSLSAPAGPGGVTFDIATADNTATTADNDYVAQSLSGQTIPAGSSTYAFNVLVNGDMTAEANQTFFVNVTSVTGANVTDGQGTGTINNDDVAITPIHDIQGPGNSSPIVGATVTTRGVVTGVKNNGFYIQEPDATVDADPATSEGVFVFTNVAPPAAAAVGNYVQVTATVVEFVPAQDQLQPPLTELSSPSVLLISTPPTAPPLPTAVTLSASFPDPAGPVDQLERVEGMRVSVASLTVVGPTLGNVNEPNATATSTGVFFGVVTGNARPFREPGIQAPDPAPAGSSIPPVPRWDANPELLRVDSDAIGAPVLNVGTGAVVTNLVGPLDYTFRRYTILPEPATPFAAAGGPTPVAATVPTGQEFTVASFNVERFFDTVNDPAIGEPVLTATAYQNRLEKASRIIRDYLRTPDVLGIVEIENLATLQDLADQINTDAGGASPQYVAYLVEGNDVGGIDVGFLVKTAPVAGVTPRVEVVEVQQELDGTLIVNPDSSTETLNDRPPLRLNAIIHHPNGASFPVTVIVNHMRSLNDVESIDPGPNGWPTLGARVRNKRQKQAEDLANLVQARQTANPSERIILIGDFNAFEFNDGFTDSMGTIEGTPVPDNETAVPGDGVDLVNPDLDNLFDTTPPSERYSFIFDGNAQSLDHVVVNEDVINATVARRLEHPRVNADFPQVFRNDTTSSTRLADHDPLVAYFQVAEFATAGVSITKGESADPVVAGSNLTYTLTVANGGPDAATGLEVTDSLPAGTTFVSFTATGWSCTTPAVGANGTVTCTLATLANGISSTIDIVVQVDPALAADTVLTNTATVTADSGDLDPSDNTATITTQATATSNYSLTLTDTPDPVLAGANLTYTLTVTNAGPGSAQTVSFSDPLPAGTTFQSLSGPGTWSCSTPSVGASGTVSCSIATLGVGSAVFTITVQVGAFVPGGTTLTNTASLSSATADSAPGDTMPSTTTLVSSPAAFTGTKTRSGGTLQPGGTVTYTIVLTNSGPAAQGDNPGDELTDVLPSSLVLVSASATAGTANANVGTNTVTWNGALGAGGSVTITIQATIRPDVAPGTVISNQAAFSYDADGNGTNEASGVTDDPGAGGASDPTTFTVAPAVTAAEIPTLGEWAMMLMTLLLAMGGAWSLRRTA